MPRALVLASGRARSLALSNDWAIPLLLLLAAGLYYARLITSGGSLFAPVPYGLTFNSMLAHLLDGRFDVDPQTIGDEGFVRGGATYAYFGIMPALLRLPFLALPHFSRSDLTTLSCLAAVCAMALFKLLSLLTVWQSAGARRSSPLLRIMIIAILASGAQIQFLKASIYQEVTLWAGACAAAFVYLVLRGYCSERGFGGRLMAGLALAAGLCLLDRVSTALGLYIAFGLLWLFLAWRQRRGTRELLRVSFLAPVLILIAFAVVAAVVNYERWGNVLQFVDLQRQILLQEWPDRLLRVREYGEFNPLRLGYGLVYYFFPIWALRGADGHLLWTAFQQRTIDAAELPPSSFLLSDPLLVGLTLYTLVHLIWHKDIPRPGVLAAVLTGLLVPILLMLCAIYMAFRYRMEFYPFFELCAFIGLGHLLAAGPARREDLLKAGAVAGIAAAHLLYILYRVSPFGPAVVSLAGTDIVSYYGAMAPVSLRFDALAAIGIAAGAMLCVLHRQVMSKRRQ